MRRVVIPELLDSDAGSPSDVRTQLADLRRINRWFGGVSTAAKLLHRVLERTNRRHLRILDVAAASGDIAQELRAQFAPAGIRLDFTLLDRRPSHLPSNSAARVVGDALALPFADSTFDLVMCSLFVHHLQPDEIVRFAREALRVARRALLVNDLRRSPLHLALVYAGLPLFRNRMSRHDARASVWRSYTSDEMLSLLRKSGARNLELANSYLYRMGVIAWR